MPSQYRNKVLKYLAIALAVIATLIGAGRAWRCYQYPYGITHCCLKALGMTLLTYAQAHDGHFPAGGGSPEASLSLLYQWDRDCEGLYLCGKTKSPEVANQILERGGLLGPDTCDWHYVEGLTLADDSRLALVWDKVGLGHDGGRLPHGGHSVLRRDCREEVIPASEWPRFLEEQERLMAARTEAAKKGYPPLMAKVRLPSGEIVEHYDAAYVLDTNSCGHGYGPSSSSTNGAKLTASVLHLQKTTDGTYTYRLRFNGWVSKPVKVEVSEGIPAPAFVIFEMEPDPAHQTAKRSSGR
jgi:hypothetical protein